MVSAIFNRDKTVLSLVMEMDQLDQPLPSFSHIFHLPYP